MFRWSRILAVVSSFFLIAGNFSAQQEDVTPVNNFELERYLGTWYEIARLDHWFERGLHAVEAEYQLRDGTNGISITNRGYSKQRSEKSTRKGHGLFVGDRDVAHLEVSFFGPFYGSYIIFYLDDDYQHAMVSGAGRDNFWILARKPTVPKEKLNELLEIANQNGFDTEFLIYVKH